MLSVLYIILYYDFPEGVFMKKKTVSSLLLLSVSVYPKTFIKNLTHPLALNCEIYLLPLKLVLV